MSQAECSAELQASLATQCTAQLDANRRTAQRRAAQHLSDVGLLLRELRAMAPPALADEVGLVAERKLSAPLQELIERARGGDDRDDSRSGAEAVPTGEPSSPMAWLQSRAQELLGGGTDDGGRGRTQRRRAVSFSRQRERRFEMRGATGFGQS